MHLCLHSTALAFSAVTTPCRVCTADRIRPRCKHSLHLADVAEARLLLRLAVLAACVPPLDVLIRCFIEVLLNVVECVLRHVRDAAVRVPPDGARSGLQLAREDLRASVW